MTNEQWNKLVNHGHGAFRRKYGGDAPHYLFELMKVAFRFDLYSVEGYARWRDRVK